MAKIIYEIYQNQVEDHPSNGKYFARVKTIETLNTRKRSIYTPDVIFGVLEKFRSCLIEQLLNSRKVKIDGLGIFYLTAECAKGGAESAEKFNVQKNIEALHIRFLPDKEQETNISSRQFLKKASFINKAALFKDAEEDAEGAEGSENMRAARRQAVAATARAEAHRAATRRAALRPQAVVKPQVATRVAAATTIPTTV